MATSAVSFEALVLSRLDRLEKQNRRLKVFNLGLLLLILPMILFIVFLILPVGLGLNSFLTLHAGRIILVDNVGQPRLELQPEFHPGTIALYDKDGEIRTMLYSKGGQSSLAFFGGKDSDRKIVSLGMREEGVHAAIRTVKDDAWVELVPVGKKLVIRYLDKEGKPLQPQP